MKLEHMYIKEIRPELGRVKDESKYLRLYTEVAEHSDDNKGKGVRIAEISDTNQPCRHQMQKLVDAGHIEVTLPAGNGVLLVDTIMGKTWLYDKGQAIEQYFDKFKKHLLEDWEFRKFVMDKEGLINHEELNLYVKELRQDTGFKKYNYLLYSALENGFDIKKRFYGFLNFRKMAKYYKIPEKTRRGLD